MTYYSLKFSFVPNSDIVPVEDVRMLTILGKGERKMINE